MEDELIITGAPAIASGVMRTLRQHGYCCVLEMTLANHRRADVVGLGPTGEIVIVEIKSSVADFRSDQKWPEYRPYCDRLFFAVDGDFPADLIPEDTGLIIADQFGGAVLREAPTHKLAGARRKAVTLRFARLASNRLRHVLDSTGASA